MMRSRVHVQVYYDELTQGKTGKYDSRIRDLKQT